MRFGVVIVAAGRGSRYGDGLPKQYRTLAGQPVLRRTVKAVQGATDTAVVVINAADRAVYDAAVAGLEGLMPPVVGGATRQASVLAGLEALVPAAPDAVLIHDAARPLVSAAVIDRVKTAIENGATGAVAALPVNDTLKREHDGTIAQTVARDGLWRAQTPQGFRFAAILAAHRAALDAALTDDAAVAERAGHRIALVQGDAANLKITTPEDMAEAERRLMTALGDIRVGHGVDVHAFGDAGKMLMLCGIAVPHECGLAGHSDADVGLHAAVDAILGAIGAEDIGAHFPPTDPTWAGADSTRFLTHAGDLVAKMGGAIAHLDITVVGERPKVGPHRQAMRAHIAAALNVDVARISVKATTTEKLGFLGRREGLAAHATATVRLPWTDRT